VQGRPGGGGLPVQVPHTVRGRPVHGQPASGESTASYSGNRERPHPGIEELLGGRRSESQDPVLTNLTGGSGSCTDEHISDLLRSASKAAIIKILLEIIINPRA